MKNINDIKPFDDMMLLRDPWAKYDRKMREEHSRPGVLEEFVREEEAFAKAYRAKHGIPEPVKPPPRKVAPLGSRPAKPKAMTPLAYYGLILIVGAIYMLVKYGTLFMHTKPTPRFSLTSMLTGW